MKCRTLPLGVDIGASRTCVALAERATDGTVRLVTAASRPTGTDVVAAIVAAREELGTHERRCVLALTAPDSLLREIAFPPLGRRERERAARFEAMRLAPFALDDGIVRLVDLGNDRHALAVARRSLLRARLATARAARLRPVAVDDAAFALLRAFAADAIVDVGLDRARLVVRGTPLPRTRVVELGGRAFTEAIVAALGVDTPTAERRKRGIGLAGAGDAVAAALVDQLTAALVDARATLPRELAAAVLTGNGARLPGLADALARAAGLPVHVATFDSAACTSLPADVARAAAPDWGLAYGLALWECAA
jgi:Tfp pilus assembly PilM family ATPase